MQLTRLSEFINARKENWDFLRAGLAGLEHVFDFSLPTHANSWDVVDGFQWDSSGCQSNCSWFGFMIGVKPSSKFNRADLVAELDKNNIGHRMLFGGNLVKQPAFVHLSQDYPDSIRIAGDLSSSDYIMNNVLFLGTYPGLTKEMLQYIIEVIRSYVISYE